MVRSIKLAAAGGAVVCLCYFAVFLVMPGFTPFDSVQCLSSSQCFNGINPAYPLVFLLSVAGTVVFVFGLFGRRFVFSPIFVIGMIGLEYGLAGVVSSSLGAQSGPNLSPVDFVPFVTIGVVVLGFQRYLQVRLRRTALQKHIPR